MFLGIMIALFAQLPKGRRSGLPPRRINLAMGICLLPWAADGINSMASELLGRPWLYAPHNGLRLATGMLCGLALGGWLYPILHEALWAGSERLPTMVNWRDLAPMGLAGSASIAILLLWTSAPFWLWAAIVVAACVATFLMVNASLVGLIWPMDASGKTFVPLALRMIGGTLLALIEMGGMAFLRMWLAG